jgi:hypothetical protein
MRYLQVGAICALIGLAGGFFLSRKISDPITITKSEIKWQDKIVYRDYPSFTPAQCIEALKCYDLSKPVLDINKIDGDVYRLDAGLCQRTWTRDIKIEVNQSGNWVYYVGVGAVAAIAGGVAAWKLGR